MFASTHQRIMEWLLGLPNWAQTSLLVAATFILGVAAILLGLGLIRRVLRRSKHVDATLESFLSGVLNAVAWVALSVVTLGVAGVNVAALVAGLAIGGFIVGFALKDTLGNLAAGVMLLFQRPFNVGDRVEIAGNEGWVEAISVATTRMKTPDNKQIVVPNGCVYGEAIVNHTAKDTRRADVSVGIAYDDDIETALKAIDDALAAHDDVLAEPEPRIRVDELADSSVNLKVMPWVETDGFWDKRARIRATLKQAVEDAGCSIPFPQRDVHMQG